MRRSLFCLFLLSLNIAAVANEPQPKVGERLPRLGDEVVVCGQLYHTTARVVPWTDPGGFDAYRVEPRFGPIDYKPTAEERGKERGMERLTTMAGTAGYPKRNVERWRGGYDLPKVKEVVDQFVPRLRRRRHGEKLF